MLLWRFVSMLRSVYPLIPSVLLAGIHSPVADSGGLFAADPSLCGVGSGAPEPADLRCQGFDADLCGCLQVPSVASDPYYGCVISGYNAAAQAGGQGSLPLVTLPGVVSAVEHSSELTNRCRDNLTPSAAASPCASLLPCRFNAACRVRCT